MESYSLSEKASLDISDIYKYGILNFGMTAAEEYLLGMVDIFKDLSTPFLQGRSAETLLSELKQIEYRQEVIFYKLVNGNVEVIRVLGKRMDFKRHLNN